MTNTIVNKIYVKDHYEVFFTTEEGNNYQGQYYAIEGKIDDAQFQKVVDNYVAGEVTPLKGVRELIEEQNIELTADQLYKQKLENEVIELQTKKNRLSVELSEMAEYLKTGETLKGISTNYDALHESNKKLADELTVQFMEIYALYKTKKTELETL